MGKDLKFFLIRVGIFIGVIGLVLIAGLFIPGTPRSKTSLLYSKLDKDSLLRNVEKPRLILVGGSNLSFGINSQMLKDSLNLNPINTGIQASLGLEYMMNEVLPTIKNGDIIIVVPEYSNFYGTFAYGGEVLCRMFFDVDLKDGFDSFQYEFRSLSLNQIKSISMHYPKFVASKFSVFEYVLIQKDSVYSRDSFNKYGDVFTHLNMSSQAYVDLDSMDDGFNYDIVDKLIQFNLDIESNGGRLMISFQPIEETSYANNKNQIDLIYRELSKNNFTILGEPSEFVVTRNLTFNGYCHLNKAGIFKRTNLLITKINKEL